MAAHATDILAEGKDNESGYGSPVVVNYIGQNPGDEEPGDDPIDEEPEDDPVDEEPDKPNPPRREMTETLIPIGDDTTFAMQWMIEGENGQRSVQLSTVSHLVVSVESDIQTQALSEIVREYVRGFFAGRMLVLLPGHDLREAALFTGLFLQFIADDDWVEQRFGVRLKLKVEEMRLTDNRANKVQTNKDFISNRALEGAKMIAQSKVFLRSV